MPRGKRVLLENACYHIINRGNQQQDIFRGKEDFKKYLELLRVCKRNFSFKLFGYCLMPNHLHLIMLPPEPETLAKIMKSLTQSYTFWFNKKHKKTGRLWQGRFKSMVVQDDDYFSRCIFYVEANPVRAGLTDSPADYPWSSYQCRVLGKKSAVSLDIPDST